LQLENSVVIANPPNPRLLYPILFILIVPTLIGLLVWMVDGSLARKIILPIVGATIGILYSALLVVRFYYWSPIKLYVTKDCVILEYRNRKEKRVGWGEILSVHVGGDEPTGLFRLPKESQMKIKDDFRPKVLTYKAAVFLKKEWLRNLNRD